MLSIIVSDLNFLQFNGSLAHTEWGYRHISVQITSFLVTIDSQHF